MIFFLNDPKEIFKLCVFVFSDIFNGRIESTKFNTFNIKGAIKKFVLMLLKRYVYFYIKTSDWLKNSTYNFFLYFWKGNSIKILEKYEKLIYWEDKNWLKPKINLKVFFFIVLPVNTWISSSLWRWSFGHCWWWWWSSLNIRILHIILYSRAQHEIDSRFVGKKKDRASEK